VYLFIGVSLFQTVGVSRYDINNIATTGRMLHLPF